MIDDYLLVVAIAMGVFAIAIPLAYGRARGGRWGERETKQRVGDDPFRGGEVTDRRPKRAPAWVRFAAGVSAAWAVASMLLFAPLHALLAAFTADSTPSPLGVIALSLVAVDSLVWPIAMLVACRALLVRRRLSTVRAALRWSYVHHGCGLLAIVIAAGQRSARARAHRARLERDRRRDRVLDRARAPRRTGDHRGRGRHDRSGVKRASGAHPLASARSPSSTPTIGA